MSEEENGRPGKLSRAPALLSSSHARSEVDLEPKAKRLRVRAHRAILVDAIITDEAKEVALVLRAHGHRVKPQVHARAEPQARAHRALINDVVVEDVAAKASRDVGLDEPYLLGVRGFKSHFPHTLFL